MEGGISIVADGCAVVRIFAAEFFSHEPAGAAEGAEILAPNLVIREVRIEANLPIPGSAHEFPPPLQINAKILTPHPPEKPGLRKKQIGCLKPKATIDSILPISPLMRKS
jgi:hypothetical protein